MKAWIQRIFSGRCSSKNTAPFAFLILLLLTFGLYLPMWGFYWDDWPAMYVTYNQVDFWQYVQSDRPFSAWPDVIFGALLGARPLAWHILYLLSWWGVTVVFWGCLRLTWPKAERQALCTALLFSVYPVFFQQAIARTYFRVNINYVFYLASLLLMLLAIRKPRRYTIFTFFALIADAAHLIALEYFWGLEFFLRPVLLWIVLKEEALPGKALLRKIFLKWLPYLSLFILVLIGRFLLFPAGDNSYSPVILSNLFHAPLTTIRDLLQAVLRDGLHILVSTWARTVDPQTILFAAVETWASWGLALVVTVGVGFYLRRLEKSNLDREDVKPAWADQAILIGFYAVFTSMIPVWLTGRQVLVGIYADRFALPAMVGASLLLVGLVYKLVPCWSHRVLILSILIGLSSGALFRVGNDYRREWDAQKNFVWQLYWRAPAIEPGTAFLSEGGIFRFVAKYSLSAALNTLYPAPKGATRLPYWAFEMDQLYYDGIDAEALQRDVELTGAIRTLSFQTSSRNSLVISYQLNKPHCLWVLTDADSEYPYLQPYTEDALSVTNLERIAPQPFDSTYPNQAIFGTEPPHTWCYYFEKADLARQLRDWETVTRLGDEAIELEYGPRDSYEWIPFIEGYIHQRKWERAVALTKATVENDPLYQPALCTAWERSLADLTLSPAENEPVALFLASLGCSP